MGIPFFAAGAHPDARVTLLVPEQGEGAEALLERMMSPPTFPISPEQLRGQWCFDTYDTGDLEIEGFGVRAREIPHKGGRTMGLRIAGASAAIAYLPDHAPHQFGPGAHGVGELHPAARELAAEVDVLIHDAQYTSAELPHRFHWGHAAADYSVELAEACGVERVLLFHHDPSRTDAEVESLRDAIDHRANVRVDIAREGDVVDL
jgi:phosphoribosyl 1,2-cyclic phosphodiesterase